MLGPDDIALGYLDCLSACGLNRFWLETPTTMVIDTENLYQVLSTDICTPIPEATVSKIVSRAPFITVPGVSNIRGLSHGNGVRPGFVYRSGNLSDITDEGKSVLVGRIGVRTIFDLRNQSEREKAPSPEIEGIKTIWMPYGVRPASLNLRDFARKDHSAIGFVKMYMGILDSAAPAFRQAFQHIRSCPNDPFIFHCSGESLNPMHQYWFSQMPFHTPFRRC